MRSTWLKHYRCRVCDRQWWRSLTDPYDRCAYCKGEPKAQCLNRFDAREYAVRKGRGREEGL